MKHQYVTLNNVKTHLVTWGDPIENEGCDVIICITGNPGITDFYIDFGAELYDSTGFPVCIIGQAGHEEVADEKSNLLSGQEHLFDLEGQLKHKLELINCFLLNYTRLHLIGHSIGAWLILELFRDNVNFNNKIATVNLLFPTLQRMAETKNGKFLNTFIRNFHLFFMLLFSIANLLPAFILTFLVKLYLKVQSVPLHYTDSILKFLRPKVGEKVLFLAYNEMDTVKKLNTDIIDRIKHFTNVIYSIHDNWTPISYMEDFKIFEPEISLQKVDVDHAFVLKSSKKVAKMVIDFINLKL